MQQISDIVFTLKAVGALRTPGSWDDAETEQVLLAYQAFLASRVAPHDGPAEQVGCRLEDGRVRLPPELVRAYQDYVELGWHLLPLSQELGGFAAPAPVCCASTELLSGASHAFQMLVGLVPSAVHVIERFGSPEQRAALIPDLVSGMALGTMCLTEADAGSDLGAIRTSAEPDHAGAWSLTGDKVFISGGGQDLSDRIVHLVLARTGPLADGVKGLSLFACPSHRPDGSRNALRVLRIEQKLGLHASPTCQLRFEAAQAHLLGAAGDGLKAMFVMMDHARLDVAMQGVAHGAHAHALATAYARQRHQRGRPIIAHADVARMLAEMDALTLGARAMVFRAATLLANPDLAAFLTPVCKVFCTDKASTVADLGIQVLGGYGYLPDYGVEQIWREVRVTRLYEGTNGVLAMTLVRRLLGGSAEAAFLDEIDLALALAPSSAARDALADMRREWIDAADAARDSQDQGMVAAALMALTGLLYFAACWVRLEAAATDQQAERVARLGQFVRAALLPDAAALRIRCQKLARIEPKDL